MSETSQYITVVNRAKNKKEFVKDFSEEFEGKISFKIRGVHSLGDFFEFDGKERFISFLELTGEESEEEIEVACHALRGKGYGINLHDNIEEAIENAKEKYSFEDNEAKRQEHIVSIRDRFPYFTATEWEQFQIFDSLYQTGKIMPIRGRFEDEPVMVISSVAHGADEIRVTPLAIIVNDHMEGNLELPFEEGDTD